MLQYFYDRNKNATSARGAKGAAVKISDVKSELKARAGLSQQEVQSNLTYLLDEKWIKETTIKKEIRTKSGMVVPSEANFYVITSAGIDRIEGPGEFTQPKFHGINIQATGQNTITIGDGNVINARFKDLGHALADLRQAIVKSDAPEVEKLKHVADIDTIESQLAKPEPTREIIATAWEAVKAAASIQGCAALVEKVYPLIAGVLA